MGQTCANNQSTQPPTFASTAAASLTQVPVSEPALNPDFFVAQ